MKCISLLVEREGTKKLDIQIELEYLLDRIIRQIIRPKIVPGKAVVLVKEDDF